MSTVDSEVADVLTFRGTFADSFDKLVFADNVVQLDLPSAYDATPERFKAFVNGTRTDLSDVSQFSDGEVDYQFEVAAGDSIRFQTRERPRYIPNYDAVWSSAFQLSDALEAGDTLRVGQISSDFDTGTDTGTGWYYEFRGGQDPRFVIFNDGVVSSVDYADYPVALTRPQRLADQYNLYNVGAHKPNVYFTDSSADADDPDNYEQLQPVSVDTDWGVGQFNIPIAYEFDIGSGNATKTLHAGSINYAILGNTTETVRDKPARNQNLASTNSQTINESDYTPIGAMRLKPDQNEVTVNLLEVSLSASNAGEVLAKAFYPEDVTFNNDNPNWSTPDQQTPDNSAIQQSLNVNQIRNQSGNLVQQSASPAGFTVGFVADPTGSARGGLTSGQSVRVDRPVYPDSIIVFFKKNDSGAGTGGGGTWGYEVRQSY